MIYYWYNLIILEEGVSDASAGHHTSRMKSKKILLLCVCIIIISILFLIIVSASKPDGDNQKSDNKEVLNSFVQLQIGKFERQNVLGSSSTYPDFWYNVNLGEMTGESNKTNIKDAKMQIIETEAICYYAEQNGIIVTDAEIQEQIENIILEGKEADNYKEIEAACESAGISFEEIVNKNKSYYIKQIYVDKVYFDEYKRYHNSESQITTEGFTDGTLEWENEWNTIRDDIVTEFKKTEKYSKLKKALDKDCEIIKAENEESFQEDIKIEWYVR